MTCRTLFAEKLGQTIDWGSPDWQFDTWQHETWQHDTNFQDESRRAGMPDPARTPRASKPWWTDETS